MRIVFRPQIKMIGYIWSIFREFIIEYLLPTLYFWQIFLAVTTLQYVRVTLDQRWPMQIQDLHYKQTYLVYLADCLLICSEKIANKFGVFMWHFILFDFIFYKEQSVFYFCYRLLFVIFFYSVIFLNTLYLDITPSFVFECIFKRNQYVFQDKLLKYILNSII